MFWCVNASREKKGSSLSDLHLTNLMQSTRHEWHKKQFRFQLTFSSWTVSHGERTQETRLHQPREERGLKLCCV